MDGQLEDIELGSMRRTRLERDEPTPPAPPRFERNTLHAQGVALLLERQGLVEQDDRDVANPEVPEDMPSHYLDCDEPLPQRRTSMQTFRLQQRMHATRLRPRHTFSLSAASGSALRRSRRFRRPFHGACASARLVAG